MDVIVISWMIATMMISVHAEKGKTMTDREKLIARLNASFEMQYSKRGLLTAQHTADDLISFGVTFQKWIPVSERLPEKMKEVLVWSCGGNFAETAFWEGHRWEKTWDHEVIHTVTYWMPLPEPSKE